MDIEKRIAEVEAIDAEQVDAALLQALTAEFEATESNSLRHVLILKLLEIAEAEKLEVDINAAIRTLSRIVDGRYKGTLIWFCSHWDCTEDIELFTYIILNDEDEAYIMALGVFENMQGPLPADVKIKVLNQLEQHYETIPEGHPKKSEIPELIELIEELPVVGL